MTSKLELFDNLSSIIGKPKKYSPTSFEQLCFTLAQEFGFTLDYVLEAPIPYLVSLINVLNLQREREQEQAKKIK